MNVRNACIVTEASDSRPAGPNTGQLTVRASDQASEATRHVWGQFGLQWSVSIQRAYKGEVTAGPFVIWFILQACFHYS